MIKIHAFDARFPLKKENRKWLYMLDPPIYDYCFELHFNDGKKKLLTDEEAIMYLNEEQEHSENALQENETHLSDLDRFRKFGPLKKRLKPVVPKETVEEILPAVAQCVCEEYPEDEIELELEPGFVTLEAITLHAKRVDAGFVVQANVKGDVLFKGHFRTDGVLKWFTDVKCSTNAKYFERNYAKLFE
jgi:hypothetical protein